MEEIKKVGVFGIGVVGRAVYDFLKEKDVDVYGYDKYKKEFPWKEDKIKECDLIIICLPTPTDRHGNQNLYEIEQILKNLKFLRYNKNILIKSTVLPGTTRNLQNKYMEMNLFHSPEFLSELTANEDFKNQKMMIIGRGIYHYPPDGQPIEKFFRRFFKVELVSSTESELIKYTANCFYATKISFFNSIYAYCKSLYFHENFTVNFETIKNLAIKSNNWINPMHTNIPGRHGPGYAGMCFPKDCKAFGKVNSFVKFVDEYNTKLREVENPNKGKIVYLDDIRADIEHLEAEDKKWDIGLVICLECGNNMKTMKKKGANKLKLECSECHAEHSIFIDRDMIIDLLNLPIEELDF